MSVRIRYENTAEPNIKLSARTYSVGFMLYRVSLDIEAFTFKILKDTTIVAQGSSTSLNNVKTKAKKALMDLGVSFVDESRTRI